MKQKLIRTWMLLVVILTISIAFQQCTEESYETPTTEANVEPIDKTHFQSPNLIDSRFFGVGTEIVVASQIDDRGLDPNDPFDTNQGNNWRAALDAAIAGWNNIPNTCITFRRATFGETPDITIIDGAALPLPSSYFGRADFPTVTNEPYHTVWINLQYRVSGSIANGPVDLDMTQLFEKRNIIAHELGHCIGFAHTDGIGTFAAVQGTQGTTDPNSIMVGDVDDIIDDSSALFISNGDRFALEQLYGSCETIPIGSITGPNPIFVGDPPSTYNWTGPGVVTWSVNIGGVLTIPGAVVGTSVSLFGNAAGVGTLTAIPAGGGAPVIMNITVIDNTNPGRGNISGPSTICTGTTANYTWTGSGTVTWSGTQGIVLSNQTGTSVTVLGNSSAGETLTATPTSGTPEGKSINVSAGPTPLSFPGPYVTGPATLNKGPLNAQQFLAWNLQTMSSYSSLSWEVISYTVQNAGQYFNVSTTGNTPTDAVVTANSNAPNGQYVMKFNITNQCGTYVVEKTFNVSDDDDIIIGGGF